MSTRRTILKFLVPCLCLPVIVGVLTVSFWASRFPLSPEETGDAERFKSYQAVIPTVTYAEIERTIGLRHKVSEEPKVEEPKKDGVISYSTIVKDFKINDCYSDLSKDLNTYLYDLAMTYAGDMWVGDIQLSPLLPLAEANQEGGRVNTSVTFSAMASSSIIDLQSVEELANLNVTDCLRSASIWKQFSKEYYTRDRGALQCNPNYGGNSELYGPSEADLLAEYIEENGCPDYGTQSDSLGHTYSVADWVANARTKHGDRFNPKSMIMMFADEKRNVEIPGILKHFPDVQNEWQVYCIMAYCHWCGSGYLTFDRDMAYAGWKSVARSDEYCRDLSSPQSIEIIYSQCLQDIQDARANGRNPVRCIDKNSGMVIYDKLVEAGAVKEWDYYFRHKVSSNGWDQGATACTYPIGMIYGVMQMNLLYSGY